MLNWKKIKKYGQRAGKEVLAVAEAAYLTMKDPQVSLRNRGLILFSLVYLLAPIDAIPDFVPGGYTDDLSVMLTAIVAAGKVGKKHLEECRLKHGLVVKVEGQHEDS